MIELNQGQEWLLSAGDGEPLTRLSMGLGWEALPHAGILGSGLPEIDLDATAVEFGDGQLLDIAFYNNLATRDGAVRLLGDNRSGRGEGDDETIVVDLAGVHPRVDTILFLVSSYQGHVVEWIRHAYCRLVDDDGVELARLTITG